MVNEKKSGNYCAFLLNTKVVALFLSCVMLCFFVLLLYCFYDMYIVLFNL